MNRAAIKFSIFQIIFFTVMWTSKTVHPIFFEIHGHLDYFGLSYSAMALAGYFSFFMGTLTDQIGSKKTLVLGSILYALGLFLRAFPDSGLLAIFSGIIAGLGASAALSASRIWMLDLAHQHNTTKWVGLKSSTTALGTALGCTLAGLLPSVLSFPHQLSLKLILLGSAGVLFCVAFVMHFFTKIQKTEKSIITKKTPFEELKYVFRVHKKTAYFTAVIGMITGFYVSFISPYLPLIMKNKGLSMAAVGLSIGSFSLFRFFVDPLIARWIDKSHTHFLKIFLTAEFSILIVTGFFALSISTDTFIALMFLRSLALGFSTISEELLWIKKFPREVVGLLFGLNQSFFFIGDFIGGTMNGLLYQKYGLPVCVFLVLASVIINMYLFVLLFKKNKTNNQNEMQVIA